jgi:Tfp pilus assembly protein PilF
LAFNRKYARAKRQAPIALAAQNRLSEAVAAWKKAIELDPGQVETHNNLGVALTDLGQPEKAIAAYREAVRLKPDHAAANLNLGCALQRMGQFSEALAVFKRFHELGPKDPQSRQQAAEGVRKCERLVELDGKLEAVLKGETKPADTAEQVLFAYICGRKGLVAASARLYEETFAAQPALSTDLNAGHRYDAARAAARAGCGQGLDAGQLDEKARARWRKQALLWLREDLKLLTKELNADSRQAQSRARRSLQGWQHHQELKCVRDAADLEKLPLQEQKAWREFWAEVEDQQKQTRSPVPAVRRSGIGSFSSGGSGRNR